MMVLYHSVARKKNKKNAIDVIRASRGYIAASGKKS